VATLILSTKTLTLISVQTAGTTAVDQLVTYRRTNHDNTHVRGYKEVGIITTPFDMTVLNDLTVSTSYGRD